MKALLNISTNLSLYAISEALIVARHIKHYYPEAAVDIAALRGNHSFAKRAKGVNQVYCLPEQVRNESEYDVVYKLTAEKELKMYHKVPPTLATQLLEDISYKPQPSLYNYESRAMADSRARVKQTLSKIPKKKGYVAIQFSSKAGDWSDYMNREVFQAIVRHVSAKGYTPMNLEWNYNFPMKNKGDKKKVWGREPIGDSDTIQAFIEQCELFIGTTPGPINVAGGTSTPTIATWLDRHPIEYFGSFHSKNVLHLVPRNHTNSLDRYGKHKEDYLKLFRDEYPHELYTDLLPAILKEVDKKL